MLGHKYSDLPYEAFLLIAVSQASYSASSGWFTKACLLAYVIEFTLQFRLSYVAC